jgi:hypothetical protein
MYYIVTMTYRVDAASPEEAVETAKDLAYEDADPASITAFPEVKNLHACETTGTAIGPDGKPVCIHGYQKEPA